MPDLSDTDVRLPKEFLLDACDDVSRWLPPPQWDPAWQSEAAGMREHRQKPSTNRRSSTPETASKAALNINRPLTS